MVVLSHSERTYCSTYITFSAKRATENITYKLILGKRNFFNFIDTDIKKIFNCKHLKTVQSLKRHLEART